MLSNSVSLWSGLRAGKDPGAELLANAFVWYDFTRSRVDAGDGSVVGQATDLTGNGRHATNQGNGSYSPAKEMTSAGLVAIKGASLKRLKALWTLSAQPRTRYILGKWSDDGYNTMVVDGGSTGRNAIWQQSTPRRPSLFAGSTVASALTSPFGEECIIKGVFNGAASYVGYELLSGGGLVESAALNAGTQGSDGVTLLADVTGGSNWTGNIAIYAEFDRLLTATEDAQVRAYLKRQSRAGLANFLCHGNSLTTGQGTATPETQAYPAVMRPLYGELFGTTNLGHSGYTTQQLQALIASEIIPKAVTGARNVLVIYEAGNDMLVNGSTGAQAWANLVAYRNAAVAAGWTGEVATCTIGPRSDVAQATIDAYNAAARAGWAAAGFSRLVDFGDDPALAVPAIDGIHYNTAQYAVVAGYMAAGLR